MAAVVVAGPVFLEDIGIGIRQQVRARFG